jgi:hypothetical protein
VLANSKRIAGLHQQAIASGFAVQALGCDGERVAVVTRLITFVDIDGPSSDDEMSLSARHEAVLSDGRRVLLLGDRGWGASGPSNIWAYESVQGVMATARIVVGPDEPPAGRSREDEEALHWAQLAEVLRQQGIAVGSWQPKQLRHDVVLSDRLLARIRHAQDVDVP